MNYRFCQFDMPEMSRALARFLVTGLAPETRIDDTEIQIHQTLWVGESVIIVGIRPDNLPDTHFADFFWG
jgi:hypothetical protein